MKKNIEDGWRSYFSDQQYAATDSERATISALVQKCLDAKGIDCIEWEREIDERVAALYGL